MMTWLIVLIFLTNQIIGSTALDRGASCTTKKSEAGICKIASNCEEIINNGYLKNPRIITTNFKRCGFSGLNEVICCPIATSTTIRAETLGDRLGISERLSEKACRRYENLYKPLLRIENNIVGGVDAHTGEFPHMVGLMRLDPTTGNLNLFCGGSLISDKWILTAAHCIKERDFIIAKIGTADLAANNREETEFYVEEKILHENYRRSQKYDDIALLRLNVTIKLSPIIYPACLETNATLEEEMVATGWGLNTTKRLTKIDILQKIDLHPVESETCLTKNNYNGLPNGLINSQFCAKSKNPNADTCQGDSGGPLQASSPSGNIFKIVGITSFGINCAIGVPGIYTKVSQYLNWIEKYVWPNNI